jgi:hypothetical protein
MTPIVEVVSVTKKPVRRSMNSSLSAAALPSRQNEAVLTESTVGADLDALEQASIGALRAGYDELMS